MISPHGGILINQVLSAQKRAGFEKIPRIPMSAIAASDLWNIATGAFSPLTGFMDDKTVVTVVNENRIGSHVWTIPITLDVSKEIADAIQPGREMGLVDPAGALQGIIEVSEVVPHQKEDRCLGTFGTLEPRHPGVATVHAMGDVLVAGRAWVFESEASNTSARSVSPAVTREHFARKGWKTVAGFQTRNVPHRAHEYLQRCALEYTDGLFIQPIDGWVKPGDFDPEVVFIAYRFFIKELYPPDRVYCSGLRTAMRYAGPKEAVFHALIRQNFGCTHFIVGRDHAGVGGFYHSYAAHRLIDTLPALDICILKFHEPFYCQRCGGTTTDKTCGHDESQRTYINGSGVREMLVGRQSIPSYIMREEIVRFLHDLQQQRSLFSDGTSS